LWAFTKEVQHDTPSAATGPASVVLCPTLFA
jgi:hypothetical protein